MGRTLLLGELEAQQRMTMFECFLFTRFPRFTTTGSSMDLPHHTVSNQRRPPSLSDTTRPGTGLNGLLFCICLTVKLGLSQVII